MKRPSFRPLLDPLEPRIALSLSTLFSDLLTNLGFNHDKTNTTQHSGQVHQAHPHKMKSALVQQHQQRLQLHQQLVDAARQSHPRAS